MFEVSQGVLIFYNIYLSQLLHFVSNRSDERFREYGAVSIFQLLGRYVRRISVVLLQSCKVSECNLVTISVLQHCHLLLLTAFIFCFQPIR